MYWIIGLVVDPFLIVGYFVHRQQLGMLKGFEHYQFRVPYMRQPFVKLYTRVTLIVCCGIIGHNMLKFGNCPWL